jgi:hypothetical protein
MRAGGDETQEVGVYGIAPGCPASGATGGSLYDKSKKNEQKACEAGVKVAQGSKPK